MHGLDSSTKEKQETGLNTSRNGPLLIDHSLEVTSNTFLVLTYLPRHMGLYLLEQRATMNPSFHQLLLSGVLQQQWEKLWMYHASIRRGLGLSH